MIKLNSTPTDLAVYVFKSLREERLGSLMPSVDILKRLLNDMFFTSLKTEEGELLNVTITLFNHNNYNSFNILERNDKWNFIPFSKPINFNVKSLSKLSKAADPWSGSLSVYYDDEGNLFINGMIDQAIHNQSFLNYETERKPEQPGIIQASIIGIGSISVLSGYENIATLKHDQLITKYLDVLNKGPISELLNTKTIKIKKELFKFLKKQNPNTIPAIDRLVKNGVKMAISRLLIKIQNYGHGGTILFSSRITTIDIKYKLNYDRLYRALLNHFKYKVLNLIELNKLDEDSPEINGNNVSINNERIISLKTQSLNELKGTIRFIASQSCVDGLVLIDNNFITKGFGAVIKKINLPKVMYTSSSEYGYLRNLKECNPEDYGTRHRSVFSHCWAYEGTLGFIISQDGDIRAVMKVNEKLIMWENIKAHQNRSSSNLTHKSSKI